jgi:DNA replication protein DnaC
MKTHNTNETDLPCRTALEEFIRQHEDLSRFVGLHRLQKIDHPKRPFFKECLDLLAEAEADPDRLYMVQFWPWRDSFKFPIAEQRAMVEDAQAGFESFKTADPLGSALHARDEENRRHEQALRDRLARKAAEKALEAEEARIAARLAEFKAQIGPELLRDFDPHHADIDRTAAAKLLAEDFTQNLIIAGAPGVGKSRCMALLALRKIEAGFDVQWTDAGEFSNLVTSLRDGEERTASLARLAALADCDYLAFDDLGSSNFTDARTARLFALVDHRHRHGLPTAFTTNCSLSGIRAMLAPDRTTGDRILRRLTGTRHDPRAAFHNFRKPSK